MEYYAAIKNDTMDSCVSCNLLLAASTFLIHHTFSPTALIPQTYSIIYLFIMLVIYCLCPPTKM